MNYDQACNLVDFLHSENYEAEVRPGYSGRGMFGRETTGVVSDIHPDTLAEFYHDDIENWHGYELPDSYRTDNMGMDFIYY